MALDERTRHREIGGVKEMIGAQTRSLVIGVVGAMIANASLTVGVLAFTR